jgi:hypothetical protein
MLSFAPATSRPPQGLMSSGCSAEGASPICVAGAAVGGPCTAGNRASSARILRSATSRRRRAPIVRKNPIGPRNIKATPTSAKNIHNPSSIDRFHSNFSQISGVRLMLEITCGIQSKLSTHPDHGGQGDFSSASLLTLAYSVIFITLGQTQHGESDGGPDHEGRQERLRPADQFRPHRTGRGG